MKAAFWARRAHKWIALLVGVQALAWMVSGLYMTAVSIDTIRGNHLVRATESRPLPQDAGLIDLQTLSRQYPGMTGFRLGTLRQRAVFEVRQQERVTLVDARTGARLQPLDATQARRLAQSLYRGNGPVERVELLDKAPREVATRPVPLWRVVFADRGGTTLYLSPSTGNLLATRHDLWRWFDFLWMLHIMDYQARTDVNNTLLRIAASAGLLFALSGVWLLFYSFTRRPRA